jgi:glyoxylase-like metal-dependent hydrolase (beta-lactamase superfamily II)
VDLDGWDPGHVVAPGVRIVPTPGHTADHVSVVVEDGERTLFIAGDASYREDLMREGVADGVTQSPETHLATLARIRAFVDEHSAIYLPTHDPESGARLDAAYA